MTNHNDFNFTDEEAHNIDVFLRWTRGERTNFTDEEIERMKSMERLTEKIQYYTEIANEATSVTENRTDEDVNKLVEARLRKYLEVADSIVRKIHGLNNKELLSRDLVFEDMEWLVAFRYDDPQLRVSFGSDGKPALTHGVDEENLPFFLYMIFMPMGEFIKTVRSEVFAAKEETRKHLSEDIDKEINKAKNHLAYLEKIKKESEEND